MEYRTKSELAKSGSEAELLVRLTSVQTSQRHCVVRTAPGPLARCTVKVLVAGIISYEEAGLAVAGKRRSFKVLSFNPP